MFGLILAAVSSAFGEVSDTIGKKTVQSRLESYYTFGFLNLFFGSVFLGLYAVWSGNFFFSMASLPFFLPRLALEIIQAHVSVIAIVRADRSDFSFIKMLTIPLLLVVDMISGYAISPLQILGIVLILGTAFTLYSIENYKTKAFWLILFTAVNAVATISLYKYDISHFNSVTAEQGIVSVVLTLYFFFLATFKARENPLSFIRHPARILQSTSSGLSGVVASFAYAFAPAVIVTTALRAFAVLFSIISGRFYFQEKRFFAKALLFLIITAGLILLIPLEAGRGRVEFTKLMSLYAGDSTHHGQISQ